MNQIARELDAKLKALDPEQAQALISLVKSAMSQIDKSEKGWPEGYFAKTAGSFAGEPLERSPQGELPNRESW